MIFVTVGGQLPFDRLVRAVDTWAGRHGRTDVVAQIGKTSFVPSHLRWQRFFSSAEFERNIESADAIVSHAGIGTILLALDHAKPILIMPRQAALREQRNDHQLATAQQLRDRALVHVAMDEDELARRLETIDGLTAEGEVDTRRRSDLLDAIRTFVSGSLGARP